MCLRQTTNCCGFTWQKTNWWATPVHSAFENAANQIPVLHFTCSWQEFSHCRHTISCTIFKANLDDSHFGTELHVTNKEGWPNWNRLSSDLKPYHSVSTELFIQNKILMRNSRIVIPQSLQLYHNLYSCTTISTESLQFQIYTPGDL